MNTIEGSWGRLLTGSLCFIYFFNSDSLSALPLFKKWRWRYFFASERVGFRCLSYAIRREGNG